MLPAIRRGLLATVVLAAATQLTAADAVSDKQKQTAVANMKKAEIAEPTTVESEQFIIATTAPDPKAKALAASLEKVYAKARTALQYEATENPWTGKLTIYYLPERRQYGMFMRSVVGQRPEDPYHFDLKG